MTAAPVRFGLSAAAFARLWSWCELGEVPPAALNVYSTAFTEAEQSAENAAADAELTGQDLLRNNRPDADAELLLGLLHRPQFAVSARLVLDDGPTRALAVWRDGQGALATHAGGLVTVDARDPAALVAGVVDLLPHHPPGPGSEVSLRRSLIDSAAKVAVDDPGEFQNALVDRGTRQATAAVYAGLFADAVRKGQFSVTVVNRRGVRTHAPEAVTFVDTDDGRYRMRDTGPEDEREVSIAPISAGAIATAVQGLVDGLDPT